MLRFNKARVTINTKFMCRHWDSFDYSELRAGRLPRETMNLIKIFKKFPEQEDLQVQPRRNLLLPDPSHRP